MLEEERSLNSRRSTAATGPTAQRSLDSICLPLLSSPPRLVRLSTMARVSNSNFGWNDLGQNKKGICSYFVVLKAHIVMRKYTLKVTVPSSTRLGDWIHWGLWKELWSCREIFFTQLYGLISLWFWKLPLTLSRYYRFPYDPPPHTNKHDWYSVPQKAHFTMRRYHTLSNRGQSESMVSVIGLENIWCKAKWDILFPRLIIQLIWTYYMARCQHFKALQTNSYLGYLKARNKNLNIDGFQWPLGYVSLRLNRSQPYFTCLIPTPCVDISSLADMGPKTDILNVWPSFPYVDIGASC